MKRITVLIILALSFVLLNQCGDKKHEALYGIWKIDFIEVNGSQLTGESIGKPLWEFNDEGGYLINIAGAIEKGSYKMKDNRLSLKSVTYKEKG